MIRNASRPTGMRTLSNEELAQVAGGEKVDLSRNNVCKKDPPAENSAFGYAMAALLIVLL